MTVADLGVIATIALGFAGIIWRISKSNADLKTSLQKEIKSVDNKVVDIDKKLIGMSVETKHVREDHDKLVRLTSIVGVNKKDINAVHGKIRDLNAFMREVENNVGKFISTFRRENNDGK